MVLRAPSKQALKESMSFLARVAYHCKWGCTPEKIFGLLREKPEKPVHTVVVRLTATSNQMVSQEARVSKESDKLRIGTDPMQCQAALNYS